MPFELVMGLLQFDGQFEQILIVYTENRRSDVLSLIPTALVHPADLSISLICAFLKKVINFC